MNDLPRQFQRYLRCVRCWLQMQRPRYEISAIFHVFLQFQHSDTGYRRSKWMYSIVKSLIYYGCSGLEPRGSFVHVDAFAFQIWTRYLRPWINWWSWWWVLSSATTGYSCEKLTYDYRWCISIAIVNNLAPAEACIIPRIHLASLLQKSTSKQYLELASRGRDRWQYVPTTDVSRHG